MSNVRTNSISTVCNQSFFVYAKLILFMWSWNNLAMLEPVIIRVVIKHWYKLTLNCGTLEGNEISWIMFEGFKPSVSHSTVNTIHIIKLQNRQNVPTTASCSSVLESQKPYPWNNTMQLDGVCNYSSTEQLLVLKCQRRSTWVILFLYIFVTKQISLWGNTQLP